MDGMTVLWIVVGVVVVLILLAVFTGAAKKSNQRSTEQVAKEHELQTRATTAQPPEPHPGTAPTDEQQAQPGTAATDEQPAQAGVLPADERPVPADEQPVQAGVVPTDELSVPAVEQQGQPVKPDAVPSAEPGPATTPHTATWGADTSGGPGPSGTPSTPSAPVAPGTPDTPGAQTPAPSGDVAAVVVDEEGDGCPSDMDSEHFGGVLDGQRPQ
ncbi:hypothetical protein [Kribbella endophytica]